MPKIAKRLYKSFQPRHYDLHLEPDADNLTFKGKVVVSGQKTGRPSKRLTFHQKHLSVTSATITYQGKDGPQDIPVTRINNQPSMYEVRLHANTLLYPGSYTISMQFEGAISEDMQGIYPCKFEHQGQSRRLIATQFESHHAREAFPCIDEPEAKATFQLTLVTPEDVTVLSNTPLEKKTIKGGSAVNKFEKTPRMSTYLLAFVFGDLHSIEAKTKQGTIVRSWGTVAQNKKTLQYSVDEAVRYLEFFTDYFEVPYPLEKCDQVALPDFDAGAMENWGLITYREIALLADPDNRSISTEQYISMVIAHELSHQWFGNLVTMKWWDDLWLNESFASLMEHMALDAVHPEWQQWEHYVASDVISTTSRDVYSDIQPVGVHVTDPDLIETLFDPGIVYAKGGRLLKMLQDYVGPDVFRKGLQTYFKKHAYGNAERINLWEALSEAYGSDLVSLMDSWITKPGMPVLNVRQNGKQLTIDQQRFMLDKDSDDSLWPVPLLAANELPEKLLTTKHAVLDLQADDFVLLNQHASGHYFVRYTEEAHRTDLNQRLQGRKIIPQSRINILNDAFMLARKGLSPLVDALETISACQDEDRDSVWAAISRIINAATQLTEGDENAEQQIHGLRKNLGQKWFSKLGWEDKPDDDPNTKQLRHTALAYMAIAEDKKVIKEALDRFYQASDVADLPAEIRALILGVAVRHGPKSAVPKLLKAYPGSTADVQLDITSALASTKDPKVAEKIIDQALGSQGFVRNQDVMRWLAVFMRNYRIREFMWNWITANWQWIEKTLGESKAFDYVPTYCANTLSTPQWQKKFEKHFLPLKNDKRLARNITIGLADIEARVAWRQRDEAPIKRWLQTKA